MTENKTGFHSLGAVWADTITAHDPLLLTVLRGLAEFECEPHRGPPSSAAAWAALGRPSNPIEAQKVEARQRRAEGPTLAELALSYVVSETAISRHTG